MKKLLTGVLILCSIGVATAQMVTYLDAQGRPFMYSSNVGGQTVYMDKNAKPIAYLVSPALGTRVEPISTPSFVFPLVSPSLYSAPLLPTLPTLPTLQ